jgi:acetate kinase
VTEGRVLVLNAGSATLKATVLDLPSTHPRSNRTVEWSSGTSAESVGETVGEVIATLADEGIDAASLAAVGHRVVHGGERFTEPTPIDDDVLAGLDAIVDLAPIHQPLAIATIRAAREHLPDAPHVAAFDTAFHATLPEAGRRYPIPDDWARDHGVRRFGFHGLSVEWSVRRAAEMLGRPVEDVRLVVAHLGGGCSVTAVDRGRSVHTSMGMTPLDGLMMGTRAGSIDPGIIFRLIRRGLVADDIERALEHDSGLVGVGGTDDMRQLLAREGAGEPRATLAVELFVRSAAGGIAAAATTLDALDALIFTGGIGENGATVRSRICAALGTLGVPSPGPADDERDMVLAGGAEGVAVIVVHAREDLVIAEAALEAARR